MGFLQEDSSGLDMMPVTSTGQIPVEKASIHLTTCRVNP